MILSKSDLRNPLKPPFLSSEKIMCIYKVSQRGLSEGQGSPGKIAGYKNYFFLLKFWDINNQIKKKCSLGAQISGGGVTLIRAMPRFVWS